MTTNRLRGRSTQRVGLAMNALGSLLAGLSSQFGTFGGFGGTIEWASSRWWWANSIGWGLLIAGFLVQWFTIAPAHKNGSTEQPRDRVTGAHDPIASREGQSMVGKSIAALCGFLMFAMVAHAKEPCVPHDDASQLICKYGKPDIDDSTAYDKPRPPIVTRMMTYKKEHVRAAYVPDGVTMGDPPPYKKWKLFGFQDPKSNAVLSADETSRRMSGREKK